MSTELVNLSFKERDLSPSEKHILTILCFRADINSHQCWPSSKSLVHDSGYSLATVNRTLSSLKIKNKIIDTGEKKGRTKSIIVYKINIHKVYHDETPLPKKLYHGDRKIYHCDTPKLYHGDIRKDHINKDQRKENFLSSNGPKTMKDILGKLKES